MSDKAPLGTDDFIKLAVFLAYFIWPILKRILAKKKKDKLNPETQAKTAEEQKPAALKKRARAKAPKVPKPKPQPRRTVSTTKTPPPRIFESAFEPMQRPVRSVDTANSPNSTRSVSQIVADAYRQPLIEFADAHSVRRSESNCALSSDKSNVFDFSRIAYDVSLWFYNDIRNLDERMRSRLSLPRDPMANIASVRTMDDWLRAISGVWLDAIFAETLASVLLGPAYLESLRPAKVNKVDGVAIPLFSPIRKTDSEKLPAPLRVMIAAHTLRLMGFDPSVETRYGHLFDELDNAKFRNEFGSTTPVAIPLGNRLTNLPVDQVFSALLPIIDATFRDQWPELGGYSLISIPGLCYLHAEHRATRTAVEQLLGGTTPHVDARILAAASILASIDSPANANEIYKLVEKAITAPRSASESATRTPSAPRRLPLGKSLQLATRDSAILTESIALGAALAKRRRGC
ncbi:MAG: hypothetical protein R3A47_02395 [Polyangiales bacterium]